METLGRLIDKDDMDFDEAVEWAVGKRKFMLNRVMQEKLLPEESDDDQEAEEEAEASVWYSLNQPTWFLQQSEIVEVLLIYLLQLNFTIAYVLHTIKPSYILSCETPHPHDVSPQRGLSSP